MANEEKCKPIEEEEDPEPEPEIIKEPEPEPPKEPEELLIIPANLTIKTKEVTMSSKWSDKRMKPYNPIKTITRFNPNWGGGEFTCVHTLNDAEGPWWRAQFSGSFTIAKVKVLNRADCCGGRLNGAKVFIGDNLFGVLNNPEQGKWATVQNRVEGSSIKI